MVSHRSQGQFDRAGWRRAVLVPVWIAQVSLALALLGLFLWRLVESLQSYHVFPTVFVVWECTNIALSAFSLQITLYEIWRFFAESLTPWSMLLSQVAKAVFALIVLALDIFIYLRHNESHYYAIAGLAIDAALILFTILPAIFAIRAYQRTTLYDEISYPANAKPYGFGDASAGQNTSSRSRLSSISGAISLRPASIISSRSSRSNRDSIPLFHPSSPPGNSDPEFGSENGNSPDLRPSSYVYNHERDTLFDDYMAARNSLALKENIDRAMAQEFGWVGGCQSGGTEDITRNNSVVGAGVVASNKARPRGDSLGRLPSYESSRVLLSVPEMEEEVPLAVHASSATKPGTSTSPPPSSCGSPGQDRPENTDPDGVQKTDRRRSSGGTSRLRPIAEASSGESIAPTSALRQIGYS